MSTCAGGVIRAALAAAAAALLLGWCAAPASAEPETRPRSAGAYLASELAALPEGEAVLVSDSLAGRYDLPVLERDLRTAFDRLKTPYYVIVGPRPDSGFTEEQLLAAAYDRLGAEGLYVYLPASGPYVTAVAHGVDVPVREAGYAVSFNDEFDFETPIDRVAREFVSAALDPDVAQRVDRLQKGAEARGPRSVAEAGYSVWDTFVSDLDPNSYTGPGNAGFLAGTAAGTVLGLGLIIAWRIPSARSAAASGGARPGPPARGSGRGPGRNQAKNRLKRESAARAKGRTTTDPKGRRKGGRR